MCCSGTPASADSTREEDSDVVTTITLRSTSRDEDAALDALADLARAIAD